LFDSNYSSFIHISWGTVSNAEHRVIVIDSKLQKHKHQ